MLHSVEEWRISAAMELDELHVRPAAAGAAGPVEPLPMMALSRTCARWEGSQGHIVVLVL